MEKSQQIIDVLTFSQQVWEMYKKHEIKPNIATDNVVKKSQQVLPLYDYSIKYALCYDKICNSIFSCSPDI